MTNGATERPAVSAHLDPAHVVGSIEQLESLYGAPVEAALIKELGSISDDYASFIEVSPFVVLATSGPEGLDCSPRGDAAGFVRVADRHTLMMPDRRGNNRLDSLRNIVRDPRVALLFLIPGIGESLRVNGTAVLSTDPDLRRSFAVDDKVPATVIVITVVSIYTQCQKALVRSRLWDPTTHVQRSALPSMGEIIQNIQAGFDGAAYDAAYPERLKQTLY